MVKNICLLVVLILSGCSEGPLFEDFSHKGAKSEKEFLVDSQKCEKEKNKHSNKIQGREFGFEGQDTGYLGCMKLEGWSKKTI
ncbi:MAG: hypothetical protein HOK41_05750 [Nitrospina sp.]|jgi:hypothetical protein|nr:hypothetical protein [Nitrospina sp.]